MKRFLVVISSLFALIVNAQIYTNKLVVDKFDDIISNQEQKTLVQKTDSTFIIEEKGKNPLTYVICNYAEYNSLGKKDSIVNLTGNVYGYQECWCVVAEKDYNNYIAGFISALIETDTNKQLTIIGDMIDKYCYYITHRVVTTQYTHAFQSEYMWIEKGENTGRTIYSR